MDREIFKGAWSAFRSRPLVWLAVSAACVPYVFSLLEPGPPVIVTFMLMFLFWCMAAYTYGAGSEFGSRAMLAEGREVMAYHWTKFLNLSVIAGLCFFIILNLAPMILFTVLAMIKPPSNYVTNILVQYVNYLIIALPVALFALVPQLAVLRHDFEDKTERATDVFKVSYQLTKDRYKDALVLFVLPELLVRTAMFPAAFLLYNAYYLSTWYGSVAVIVLLLVLALMEGARISYVTAAFNLFLDRVETEERAKGKKKKAPAKSAPEERKPPAKKEQARKPGPSPHKKKK